MRTINISIPQSLADKIERAMNQKKFASRSELVRSALRIFFSLESAQKEGLDVYNKKPVQTVKKELLKSGYSSKFANSVAEGLEKSSVYSTNNED